MWQSPAYCNSLLKSRSLKTTTGSNPVAAANFMLMKRIVEEFALYEGLEITHEVQSSVYHLIRMWNFDGRVMYENVNNTIKMVINEPIDVKEFDTVLKHIENFMGYFPSHIVIPKSNFKYNYKKATELINKGIVFGVYFDAKYDQEISEKTLPDFLYHITPSIYEDKILKIGIVPKKKDKLSNHPNRIYVAFTQSAAEGLLNNDPFVKNINDFTLFSINIKELKKVRKIRFFEDPVYVDRGLYTYENIPPQYLTVIKRVII